MAIKNALDSITVFFNGVIANIQGMGYSAYAALGVLLVLLLIMLIFRRIKPVFWLFFAAAAAFATYMLYYVMADIKILLFIRLGNTLAAYDKKELVIMGIVILGIILVAGLISIVIGAARGGKKAAGE